MHSKNSEVATSNNGGQLINMEIINMIDYIEQTVKTFENTTRYQLDPIGHVANLSEKKFPKGTF